MTDSNKQTAVVIGKLVLISVLAALLLAITYIPTSAQLEENMIAAQKEILGQLMPNAQNFEPVEGAENAEGEREILYYRAVDDSGNIIGYAFFREQGGAQGPIVVAGAVDSSFSNVLGMDVLSHEETPGLGSKITNTEFRSQFEDIPVSQLALSSSGGSIDSITGATISSQAVVDAMDAKIEEIEEAEA
ncbi:RnfABCDGE type electron transport complex subunit G [Methanolobus zinderi]|jgi:electron transport complex protein RnfG|uniref:Ion-translocating oxidoreductase complex subunit G n=1 Tax=Methanolobus zinderi TaxID=536044 RepID=A0A7D5E5R0_9EURY|nr:Rnf electron transport complex subunit RnfG [Methanolobus zinderi]KXS45188.1 MAG: electron transport complex, RnfABCDGE type, G subunit [Methanolobus sp. T82-4]QLC49213.1 RnfABCDGE type electron transport complex subunit G [Methanolobus zinderi]